jgi:hypothetical protein
MSAALGGHASEGTDEMSKMLRMSATAITIAAAFAVTANAQTRPDARNMTCHQVQSLIADRGAAVITTGRHTYDRYVAHQGYCAVPYTTRPHLISTRDGACSVLRCAEPLFERFRRH